MTQKEPDMRTARTLFAAIAMLIVLSCFLALAATADAQETTVKFKIIDGGKKKDTYLN